MSIPGLPINLHWNNVITDVRTGRTYHYPGKFTLYMRESYSRPAVYKWFVHSVESGKGEEAYIGEAEDLVRRIQRVLTPSKTPKPGNTNAKLKSTFDQTVASGRFVSLAILDFSPFEFGGVVFAPHSLSNQYRRRMMENLCLCDAEARGQKLINGSLDDAERLAGQFRELPLSVQRKKLKGALE